MVGEPFLQLESSVDASKTGEVVVSQKCWDLVSHRFKGEPRGEDWLVTGISDPLPIRGVDPVQLDVEAQAALRCYIPKGVQVRIDSHQSAWLAELRRVTVLFVKLNSLTYSKDEQFDWQAVHDVLCFMQSVIFRYEGMVRQFLVDDKGTVLVRRGTYHLPRSVLDSFSFSLRHPSCLPLLSRSVRCFFLFYFATAVIPIDPS